MPLEQRERYARAIWHAIVDRDVQFAVADLFGDWWLSNWQAYDDDVAAGFAAWSKRKPEL